MEKASIFRKKALEKLESPEQLDHVIQVATPKGWVFLAVIMGWILLVLLWSIFGVIPAEVTGEGILVKGQGLMDICAESDGRVASVSVRAGDAVKSGQVLAKISARYTENELKLANLNLTDAKQKWTLFSQYQSEIQTNKRQDFAQQRSLTQDKIEKTKEQAKWIAQRLDSKEKLAAEGLISQDSLLQAKQAYLDIQNEIKRLQSQEQQLNIQAKQAEQAFIQEKTVMSQSVQTAQVVSEQSAGKQAASEWIRCLKDGMITEIKTQVGDRVVAGQPVMTMELGGAKNRLEAILFIPASQGKRIYPGMVLHLSPATAKREEYGYILGHVRYVSAYPATNEAMMVHLKNQGLITQLTQSEPVLQVIADLEPDPRSISGFHWSSRKGPPYKIESGTLCHGAVVVARHRPIFFLFPYIKRHLGFN